MGGHLNYRDCITLPLRTFSRVSGNGLTKIYELIAADEIKSVTVGRRRLIIVQSYLDLLARQAQNAPPIASPNPRAGSRASKEASCAPRTAATQRDVEGPRRRITEQEHPAEKPKPARRRPGRPRRAV